MIIDYLAQYGIILFELVGLLILSFISVHISKKAVTLTRISILLIIIETIVTFFEEWLAKFDSYTVIRPILTGFKYIIYPSILIVMVHTVAPFAKHRMLKASLFHIPLTICIPLFLTTQWTHIICYYNENNNFIKGPLFYLPYILFTFYFLVFIVQNIVKVKKYSYFNRFFLLFIVFGVAAGIAIRIATNMAGNYTFLLSSGVVLYYLFTYINMATLDPLTGIYNRQSYYKALKTDIEKITAVVSIDMNRLKYVNDNYGHSKGDEALKAVSQVILENMGSEGKVYRIGGDEFIILYQLVNETIVKSRIGLMKTELSRTEYSCSFGYAMNDHKTNIKDLIIKADENMYKDKEAVKRVE